MVTLEIKHPISRHVLFSKVGLVVNSMPLNKYEKEDLLGGPSLIRHLYHKKIEDIMNIPVGMILFNLFWAKSDNPSI